MGLVGSGEGSGGWPVLVCQRARALRRGSGAQGRPKRRTETADATSWADQIVLLTKLQLSCCCFCVSRKSTHLGTRVVGK